MKYRKIKIIPALALLVIVIACAIMKLPSAGIDLSQYKAVTVKRCVDGDTFIYEENGADIRCRLIGIDTPESVASDESRNSEEGVIASDYTKSLIAGKTVYLEYDAGRYDNYGRELCYVYLADGQMLNEILLEKGYARTMTVQPNAKYANKFLEIQSKAQENQVGFWGSYY